MENVGLRGDGPKVQEMTDGKFDPPVDLNEHSKAYLRALTSPSKNDLENIPRPVITKKNNIEDLQKASGKTSLPLQVFIVDHGK